MPTFKSIDEMLSRKESKWKDRDFRLSPDISLLWRTNSTRNPVYIEKQNDFTIDGGENGVTIYGTSLVLYKCKRVTLRNLTIRLGAKGLTRDERKRLKKNFLGYNGEALKIDGCEEILIENCSFSWSLDETLSIESSKDIKVKECMISYPLNNPKNFSGEELWEKNNENHAYPVSTRGCRRVSYRRCVFAHGVKRSPQFAAKGDFDTVGEVRHSICYNFTKVGTKFHANANGDFEIKIHDNYYTKHVDMAIPILIEGPEEGRTTVKFWRNVLGSPDQFRNGMGQEVMPVTKGRVNTNNKGSGNPTTTFDEILSVAGPKGNATNYTTLVKKQISEGKLPDPLHPHEPRGFRG